MENFIIFIIWYLIGFISMIIIHIHDRKINLPRIIMTFILSTLGVWVLIKVIHFYYQDKKQLKKYRNEQIKNVYRK